MLLKFTENFEPLR